MGNIIIVGANRGIGYHMAERLLELGNSVAVLGVSTDGVEKLREKYSETLLPITDTESASGLPIPKELKADTKKVGYGLAERIWLKKYMICHSFSQSLQMKLCYRHPLYRGKMMAKATSRAANR